MKNHFLLFTILFLFVSCNSRKDSDSAKTVDMELQNATDTVAVELDSLADDATVVEDTIVADELEYDSYIYEDEESNNSKPSLWKSGFLNDKFGEKDYSKPYIFLLLKGAYWSGQKINAGEGIIGIQVFRNAISFRAMDTHYIRSGDYLTPDQVLIRTDQGDYKIDTKVYGEVEAICINKDDLQFMEQQLDKGNFIINVGGLLYKVTNESSGFMEAYNTYLLNNN